MTCWVMYLVIQLIGKQMLSKHEYHLSVSFYGVHIKKSFHACAFVSLVLLTSVNNMRNRFL